VLQAGVRVAVREQATCVVAEWRSEMHGNAARAAHAACDVTRRAASRAALRKCGGARVARRHTACIRAYASCVYAAVTRLQRVEYGKTRTRQARQAQQAAEMRRRGRERRYNARRLDRRMAAVAGSAVV